MKKSQVVSLCTFAAISLMLSGCGGGGGGGSSVEPFKFISQSFTCKEGAMTIDGKDMADAFTKVQYSMSFDMDELKVMAHNEQAMNVTMGPGKFMTQDIKFDVLYDVTTKLFTHHTEDKAADPETGKLVPTHTCEQFTVTAEPADIKKCLAEKENTLKRDDQNMVELMAEKDTYKFPDPAAPEDPEKKIEKVGENTFKWEVSDNNAIMKLVMSTQSPINKEKPGEAPTDLQTTVYTYTGTAEVGAPPTSTFEIPQDWGTCADPKDAKTMSQELIRTSFGSIPGPMWECLGMPMPKDKDPDGPKHAFFASRVEFMSKVKATKAAIQKKRNKDHEKVVV